MRPSEPRVPDRIRVRLLDPRAQIPSRAHPGDAGLDLHGLERHELAPGSTALVGTGIAAEIPWAHVGMIADRSSLARRGLKTAGGIIDSGYRGEIRVVLWNLSRETQVLEAGERVAQLLLIPVSLAAPESADELAVTSRGEGGFGSTGR